MNYDYLLMNYTDIIIGPLYLLLIYLWARSYQRKRQATYPVYKWYTKGLMVKCFGAILVCLVYQFYYGGGDTINFIYSAQVLSRVFEKDMFIFFRILFGDDSWEVFSVFDNSTGWPLYYRKDPAAFFAVRCFTPLAIISFKSYLGTAVLLATICYIGIWRLFLLFNYVFPKMDKQFAISILFIPSIVFWGSGVLKDTITLGATGLFAAHFYSLMIQRKYNVSNFIYIGTAVFLMLSIKPYILFALIPGSIVWISNEQLAKMNSAAIRTFLAPIIFVFSIGLGYVVLSQMSGYLGAYSLDNVLQKAVISNVDQKQSYYGGNSFDIGDFDASVEGVSKKAHLAIFATLYRPTLLEARNPLMLISALENTYLLLLTVLLIFRLKLFGFLRVIGDKPLLVFSLLFSLFFAFSVGIATSNFGTLVRLKIPCIPFFVSSLFVIRHLYEQKTNKKLGI
jgi:hypothetical protein